MNITKENIDNLNALLKIQISPEDYQGKVDSSIRDFAKKANINGFRKGKVPPGVIRKMHGNELLADEISKLINDGIGNYLSENKIDILGRPLPADEEQQMIDIQKPLDYSFTYELGLAPEFTVQALQDKPKIDRHKIQLEATEIDKEIEAVRKRLGENEEVEAVEEGDLLYLDLAELDEEGNEKEEGHKNSTVIPTDLFEEKILKKKILGLKKDAQLDLEIFKVFNKEKDEILKQVLYLKEAPTHPLSENFRFTLTKVSRLAEAELNQELFDKVFGKDAISDEAGFRAKMETEVQKIYDESSERKLENDLLRKVIDTTEVPLPETFLKKFIKTSNEKPIDDQPLDEGFEDFAKGIRWSLIRNKLAVENDIKVEPQDVNDYARGDIENRFRQYGYPDMGEEFTQKMVADLLKDEKYRQEAVDKIIDTKLITVIKEQVEIVDNWVSLDDFHAMSKQDSHAHEHEH